MSKKVASFCGAPFHICMGASQAGWEKVTPGFFSRKTYHLALSRGSGTFLYRIGQGAEQSLTLRRGFVIATLTQNTREVYVGLEMAASFATEIQFAEGTKFDARAAGTPVCLATWLRQRSDKMLDTRRINELASQWTACALKLDANLAPRSEWCELPEQRILRVLAQSTRLEKIARLAEVPRYRLITFLHFLQMGGALHANHLTTHQAAVGKQQENDASASPQK